MSKKLGTTQVLDIIQTLELHVRQQGDSRLANALVTIALQPGPELKHTLKCTEETIGVFQGEVSLGVNQLRIAILETIRDLILATNS